MRIETIQITADAYYYLRNGEEPIDPDNIDEALEIQSMFAPGFEFITEPEPIDGTDMVEVTISVTDEKKIAGDSVVQFTVLPDHLVKVKVLDTKANKAERDKIEKLELIGDAYWAEYAYHEDSKMRNLLPVCKIAEYRNLIG